MDEKGPKEKETKGVPWADHNDTESSPAKRNPDEYGDENPYQKPGEQVAEPPRPNTPERESLDERVEREQER